MQGRGRIMIGGQWNDTASPLGLDGANTQSVHVQLLAGIDEHCAHARANGAVIVREPSDEFYGDRVYRAIDHEGHRWAFCDEGPRRHARRGRGRPRPTDHGHQLAMSAAARRRHVARAADPIRRRAIELLAERPRRRRRVGRGARRQPIGDEQAPAHAARAQLVTESHPEFDARVRIYSLHIGADGRAAFVAGPRRTRLGRAARRLRQHIERPRHDHRVARLRGDARGATPARRLRSSPRRSVGGGDPTASSQFTRGTNRHACVHEGEPERLDRDLRRRRPRSRSATC